MFKCVCVSESVCVCVFSLCGTVTQSLMCFLSPWSRGKTSPQTGFISCISPFPEPPLSFLLPPSLPLTICIGLFRYPPITKKKEGGYLTSLTQSSDSCPLASSHLFTSSSLLTRSFPFHWVVISRTQRRKSFFNREKTTFMSTGQDPVLASSPFPLYSCHPDEGKYAKGHMMTQ